MHDDKYERFLQTNLSKVPRTTSEDEPEGLVSFVDHSEDKRVFRLAKKGRGGDPIGMLNAVLTSDVPKDVRFGTYAFLLDAKAKIQTDITVVRDGDDLLIVTELAGAKPAQDILGRYAPFSRVEMTELKAPIFALYGDDISGIIGVSPAEYESVSVEIAGVPTIATGISLPLNGVLLICDSSGSSAIPQALEDLGVQRIPGEELQTLRIAASSPSFGVDITPDNFPAETNIQERAVSFTKGCYPGQETVARTHYRGKPNKHFHRFTVKGDVQPGEVITQNDRDVGYVTSIAPLLIDGKTYALGYLKRKADVGGELVAGGAILEVSETKAL